MNADEYDQKHAAQVSEWIKSEEWMNVINLHKTLCLTANPDRDLRIELLAGIAMAQVGMARSFTTALENAGLELRAELNVTADEAKEIATIIGMSLNLHADGMSKVEYPNGEVEQSS